jgi:hypothetical protein
MIQGTTTRALSASSLDGEEVTVIPILRSRNTLQTLLVTLFIGPAESVCSFWMLKPLFQTFVRPHQNFDKVASQLAFLMRTSRS